MWTKLLAGGATALLVGFLIWMFGNARYASGHKDAEITTAAMVLAAEKRAGVASLDAEQFKSHAIETWAGRALALQPIIVRSTDTVKTYAQTPAGSVRCLAADRMLGIDALDRELFPFTAPASGGAQAVRSDDGAPPAGRVGDQR